MIQKTTPTLQFNIADFDLTGWDVSIYIKQSGVDFTISEPNVAYADGHTTVSCQLTAMQTLALGAGTAYAQVYASKNGDCVASQTLPFTVSKILNRSLE